MSNSFDPDQARHFVGPDLGGNCLQRSSVDDKIATADKELTSHPSPYFFSYVRIFSVVDSELNVLCLDTTQNS